MGVALDTSVFVPIVQIGAMFRSVKAERDGLSVRLGEAQRETQRAVARIVEQAHSLADDKNYCSDFDDFMEELGLPRRNKDFTVFVDVAFEVAVTVSARDDDDAMSMVEAEDVLEAVNAKVRYDFDSSHWETSYAEEA